MGWRSGRLLPAPSAQRPAPSAGLESVAPVMTARARTLLILFAALGLAASSASTYVHHRLLTDPAYSSVCDISATVSCTDAYLSRYGTLWGVPVAVAGGV